jgi:hypothetical protein
LNPVVARRDDATSARSVSTPVGWFEVGKNPGIEELIPPPKKK